MLNDIRHELLKIILQKKNYIAAVGHMVLLILCVVGMSRASEFYHFCNFKNLGLRLEDFLKFIDGMFFSRCMLLPTFVILLPCLICTVGGDLVAGEMQDGSLRLHASRTRGRSSIILSKLIAMFIFSFAYCVYFGTINMAVGYAFFGWNKTQIIPLFEMGIGTDLEIMSTSKALARYAIIIAYYGFSTMALGCVTIFFSTIFDRMTSATAAGTTLYYISYILENLPLLASMKPYLLSRVMNGCVLFWLDPIPVWRIAHNASYLVLYITVFCAAALIVFNNKDIN